MPEVKHPTVQVRLTERTSAYVLASRTRAALKRAGVPNDECAAFFAEALVVGDSYDHTVQTMKKWVTVT